MTNLADPKYVAKSAVKMFRTRTNINDEEFEEILGLCDVSYISTYVCSIEYADIIMHACHCTYSLKSYILVLILVS